MQLGGAVKRQSHIQQATIRVMGMRRQPMPLRFLMTKRTPSGTLPMPCHTRPYEALCWGDHGQYRTGKLTGSAWPLVDCTAPVGAASQRDILAGMLSTSPSRSSGGVWYASAAFAQVTSLQTSRLVQHVGGSFVKRIV